MAEGCVFCAIAQGGAPASIVCENELALAVVDLRQFHPGHPNQGLSLWHSIGEAAFQEVPHLHIHIHPRLTGDDVLYVYPRLPGNEERSTLDSYAAILRAHLE